MNLFDDVGQLLQRVSGGQLGEGEAHAAFDQVAREVPLTLQQALVEATGAGALALLVSKISASRR